MDLESLKRHWENAGAKPSSGVVTPTSRDPFLSQLEVENILPWLNKRKTVLEVGCGDAVHTLRYARKARKLVALDVADSLIARARKRAKNEKIRNVEFVTESVLNLGRVEFGTLFDCIISQRCLINLPDWRCQKNAILLLHELLKKDGILLLTEGFQRELDELNRLRRKVNLTKIMVVPYNRNLEREKFERFIKPCFSVEKVVDYGTYLLLSRVYHPLAVSPKNPKHDSPLNEAAMRMAQIVSFPDVARYSYSLFYALRKK